MADKEKIRIDESRCIGCGLCVEDCVASHLVLNSGKAVIREGMCIECGHCFAICPQNAVEMVRQDTSDCREAVSMETIDSDTLLEAMKSRRSIRSFRAEPVPKESLAKILEAGRFSPTGSNAQDVCFTILGSRQDAIEKECVALFRKGQNLASGILRFLKNTQIDDRFFFKGAPLVIVISGKGEVNASLASSYMELMAESCGLGVLYSGFFILCCRLSGKILKMLELPAGCKPVTCMVIGVPAVKYQRQVPRKELNVNQL